jgi:hypothetical protein
MGRQPEDNAPVSLFKLGSCGEIDRLEAVAEAIAGQDQQSSLVSHKERLSQPPIEPRLKGDDHSFLVAVWSRNGTIIDSVDIALRAIGCVA